MGAGQAAEIRRNLIEAGRDPETPVTVVIEGSLPEERMISGRLKELDLLIRVHAVTQPAMLFIGRTAALASHRTEASGALEAAA